MADLFRALEPEKGPPAELLDECRAFIGLAHWTWARTYERFAPHWYCLRHRVRAQGLEEEFDAFARYIDDYGYRGAFGRAERLYLNLDGYRFWKMEPVGQPPISVLNKALIVESAQLSLEVER